MRGRPAIDLDSGRFYLTLRPPDPTGPSVVAMRYAGGALTGLWSADVLDGGTSSSPSLSADGTTVYAGDNQGTLWALDAATGQVRWNQSLGYPAAGTPSVSADGLIIPAPGEGGHLLALRDEGDHAEVAWERGDVAPVGASAQAGGAVGYTEVREGPDASAPTALLTFDTETGETLDQDTLPGGSGPTIGTAIGPDGEVLTTDRDRRAVRPASAPVAPGAARTTKPTGVRPIRVSTTDMRRGSTQFQPAATPPGPRRHRGPGSPATPDVEPGQLLTQRLLGVLELFEDPEAAHAGGHRVAGQVGDPRVQLPQPVPRP